MLESAIECGLFALCAMAAVAELRRERALAPGPAGVHDLALLCCDEGRWEEAEHWIAVGWEDPPAPPGTLISIARAAVTARLAAQRGELAEALSLARGAVELTEQTDRSNAATPAWLALAEVLRQDDEVAEADAAVAAAVRIYEQKGNVAAIAGLRAGARSPRQTPA